MACSTRQDPQVQKSAGPQVASCDIDAKSICQQIADKPVNAGGMMLPPREREDSSSPTQWEYVPIEIPNGATLQVNCELNVKHNSVVYASITKGPALKESDVDYLRGHGYCAP
jgi:hypothetical protein